MATYPPDTRLDGPVHRHFGLSYSNYLVLHRTLMQSMPVDWQMRMVASLEELHAAYAHRERPSFFLVQPAKECSYSDLSEADMRRVGVERSNEKIEPDVFFDADGNEHEPDDRLLVPDGYDTIPHYNRGRTYVEPHATEATR